MTAHEKRDHWPHIFEIKIIVVGVVTFSILATCTVLQMVLFTVLIDCDFKKTVANDRSMQCFCITPFI